MPTKNTTGQNQALVRETNIRLILNQFKSHDMSTSDVANFFHLSNSGAKKIIDEILQTDIPVSAPRVSAKTEGQASEYAHIEFRLRDFSHHRLFFERTALLRYLWQNVVYAKNALFIRGK